MFPFDLEDEEIDLEEIEEEELGPADYEIDFETGHLTGNIITGLDALIQWARLALSIDRYVYPQYSWDYGCEVKSLIGKNYNPEYIVSEVKRMVTETLTVNEHIEGITNFSCQLVGDSLTASFRLETVYGNGEVEIDV